MRNEGRWNDIVDQAEKAYGRLDILCNIAGISGRDPKLNIQTGHTAGPRLADQTLEHWNWVMEINSTGVFLGTKHANIVNLQLVHRDGSFQTFHLDVEVHDLAHLHAIIAALRGADQVSSVERI